MAEEEYSQSRPRSQPLRPGQVDQARTSGDPRALLLLLAGCLLLSSCQPPDHPPLLPGGLPVAVVELFDPGRVRALSPAPGLAYFGLRTPEGPWAIHLIRLDLGRCELGLRVLRAPKEEGKTGGHSPVTSLLGQGEATVEGTAGPVVLAGVNGDFFTPEGLPVGTEVVGGDIRRIGRRPAFAWRPGVDPWMGVPGSEGDSVLTLGWDLSRIEPDRATQVVGGFPLLLKGGSRVGDLRVADLPSFAAARHPRTAVGFDPSRDYLWIVVVDGRQPGYSEGMTLPELASLLESLGAAEAVNLDGGGSSVMVLEGLAVSHPSDATGERPVVNALGIVRDQAYCRVDR